MNPVLIAAAALAGTLAGALVSRIMAGHPYRRDAETQLPPFTGGRWLPVLTALGAAAVASHGSWERMVMAAPILTLGVWLGAVDADVQRLPFPQVIALTLAETAAAAAIATAHHSPWPIAWGLAGGILAYLGFRIFHALARGQLGYGDVTLAAPLGIAVTTLGGATSAWIWLMASFVPAAIVGLARRRSQPAALGPWLLLGAIVALTL